MMACKSTVVSIRTSSYSIKNSAFCPHCIDGYLSVNSINRLIFVMETKTKLNSVVLIRERTIPIERPPLVGKVSARFADEGCRVVSSTYSHGR
jgi:hypothetical protein